jgi:two-component system sensor histidine kinase PrrB
VVEDDGHGVPAADRGRVLAQFQRGDTTAAGVGLGLAIVAGQARWHGGDVELQDSDLGGLRVLVTVPSRTAPLRSRTGRCCRR